MIVTKFIFPQIFFSSRTNCYYSINIEIMPVTYLKILCVPFRLLIQVFSLLYHPSAIVIFCSVLFRSALSELSYRNLLGKDKAIQNIYENIPINIFMLYILRLAVCTNNGSSIYRIANYFLIALSIVLFLNSTY